MVHHDKPTHCGRGGGRLHQPISHGVERRALGRLDQHGGYAPLPPHRLSDRWGGSAPGRAACRRGKARFENPARPAPVRRSRWTRYPIHAVLHRPGSPWSASACSKLRVVGIVCVQVFGRGGLSGTARGVSRSLLQGTGAICRVPLVVSFQLGHALLVGRDPAPP